MPWQDVCPSVCLSVCLSHAGIVSKRPNVSTNFLNHGVAARPHHSSFSTPNVMAIFRRVPPNGDTECRYGMKSGNFQQISRFISETIQDRAMVTIERDTDSYAIYRVLLFPMTLNDPQLKFQGHTIIKAASVALPMALYKYVYDYDYDYDSKSGFTQRACPSACPFVCLSNA